MTESHVPSTLLLPVRRERWYQHLKSWLWGYDFFISYHWASGGTYAVNLAQRLREKNYDVFLDRADYASGDDWKAIGEMALRNTQRLVLIATREAVTISKPVEHEIGLFTARNRQVISIVFGDKFEDLDRSQYLTLNRMPDSKPYIEDGKETLASGPSEKTVAELTRTQGVMRRRNLRALLTLIPAVAVIAFASFAGVSWINALNSAEKAETERRTAVGERNTANNERDNAPVSGARFSQDESRVLTWASSSKSNGEVRLWDVINPEPIQIFKRDRNIGAEFSQDESRLLTWSEDGIVRVWDVARAEPIQTFKHDRTVAGARFIRDESRILAWSDKVCIWDCSDPLAHLLTPTERILELTVRSGTTLDGRQNLQTLEFNEWQALAESPKYAKVKEKLPARKVEAAEAAEANR